MTTKNNNINFDLTSNKRLLFSFLFNFNKYTPPAGKKQNKKSYISLELFKISRYKIFI